MARELAPMHGLAPDVKEFIRRVALGDDPVKVGIAMGKSEAYGHNLLRQSAIIFALRLETQRLLATEAAPLGLKVLMGLARDETAPAAIRRQAASDLLNRAGHVPPRPENEQSSKTDKPLSELSTDELRALVDKLDGELAERAKPVDAAKRSSDT
jgi:hypothetical protein